MSKFWESWLSIVDPCGGILRQVKVVEKSFADERAAWKTELQAARSDRDSYIQIAQDQLKDIVRLQDAVIAKDARIVVLNDEFADISIVSETRLTEIDRLNADNHGKQLKFENLQESYQSALDEIGQWRKECREEIAKREAAESRVHQLEESIRSHHIKLIALVDDLECLEAIEQPQKFEGLTELCENSYQTPMGRDFVWGKSAAIRLSQRNGYPLMWTHNGHRLIVNPDGSTDVSTSEKPKQVPIYEDGDEWDAVLKAKEDRNSFVVTNDWIDKNATTKLGGWTYAQFEALGLPCPPRRGWRELIVGKIITKAQKKSFEDAKNIKRDRKS